MKSLFRQKFQVVLYLWPIDWVKCSLSPALLQRSSDVNASWSSGWS